VVGLRTKRDEPYSERRYLQGTRLFYFSPPLPTAHPIHLSSIPDDRFRGASTQSEVEGNPMENLYIENHVPYSHDYSHLVTCPKKEHDKELDAEFFHGLLTEYDRILLRFGMRVEW
jgi:hypothetical protein